MDAFAAEFFDRQATRWKPQTRDTNARIVQKVILPAFGEMTVDAITIEHVRDWFASMADKPGSAIRALPVSRRRSHTRLAHFPHPLSHHLSVGFANRVAPYRTYIPRSRRQFRCRDDQPR